MIIIKTVWMAWVVPCVIWLGYGLITECDWITHCNKVKYSRVCCRGSETVESRNVAPVAEPGRGHLTHIREIGSARDVCSLACGRRPMACGLTVAGARLLRAVGPVSPDPALAHRTRHASIYLSLSLSLSVGVRVGCDLGPWTSADVCCHRRRRTVLT